MQNIPASQQAYYAPQRAYGYGTGYPQYNEKTSSPLKYLGLIMGILLIVSGAIWVANSGSSQPSSPAPQVTSSVPVIPPAAGENNADIGTLPEYVQQYTNKQPPYQKCLGQRIDLVNNPDARDVSFAELKSFILQDSTDEGDYIEGERMCGEFAEMLHNNAEQKGIRAAFVGVDFEYETMGHALNGFQTTDRGFVFIDCTGDKEKIKMTDEELANDKLYPCQHDRVGYIDKGREYGTVAIDKAESLKYDFYVEYTQSWQKLNAMIEEFKTEVDAFNIALGGRTTLPEPEYSRFKDWEADIEEQRQAIKQMAEKLGYCMAEPLGIVKAVGIYW
jgi:hypothetical protein